MNLQSIQFQTYKAFKKPQVFAIKPITIIVGKNSSGKSALARLPLLISQSLKTNSEEPLKIQFEGIEFGGFFTDLIYNKFSHGSIKMTLQLADETTIEFEVQNISDTPLQIISMWKLTSPHFNLEMEIEFERANVLKPDFRYYKVNGERLLVDFKGLFPASIKDEKDDYKFFDELELYSDILDINANQMEYIGPLRETAHRSYSYSGFWPKKLGYKGEFAPHVLGMSTFTNPELIDKVGNWFKEHLGYELNIVKDIKTFEVVLVNPYDPTVQINIVDVGQGISQVLPLVVRCFWNHSPNSITIVEQPELHLHPAAHADLAELFALTSKNEKSSFIIETHSENIILRIRRLVTEGQISAENVIIYWVDDDDSEGSQIQSITIDENGELSDWPTGVFSEDYEEVLAINAAQKKRTTK